MDTARLRNHLRTTLGTEAELRIRPIMTTLTIRREELASGELAGTKPGTPNPIITAIIRTLQAQVHPAISAVHILKLSGGTSGVERMLLGTVPLEPRLQPMRIEVEGLIFYLLGQYRDGIYVVVAR